MKVVSNTSPLLNLAIIGELSLLHRLFQKVIVPDAVWSELEAHLSKPGMPAMLGIPSWVEKRALASRPLVNSLSLELDSGEAEALALAVEMDADLVLLDERLARRVASRLGLKFAGLLGLLVEAKRRGLIPLVAPKLDALRAQAGFWLGDSLYERVLSEVGE